MNTPPRNPCDVWLGDKVAELDFAFKRYYPLIAALFIANAVVYLLVNRADRGVVVLLSMFVFAIITLAVVVHFLFRRQHFHLAELVIVVAVLGNALGAALLWIERVSDPQMRVWLSLAATMAILLWVLGAAAWAFWVAGVFRNEVCRSRLKILVIGILAPPCFLAFWPALVFGILGLEDSTLRQPVPCPPIVLLFLALASGYILILASRLHRTARVIEISDLADKLSPPPLKFRMLRAEPAKGNTEDERPA